MGFWQVVLAVIVALVLLSVLAGLIRKASDATYRARATREAQALRESNTWRLYGTAYPDSPRQPEVAFWQQRAYNGQQRTCYHGVPTSKVCAVCVPGAEGAVWPEGWQERSRSSGGGK